MAHSCRCLSVLISLCFFLQSLLVVGMPDLPFGDINVIVVTDVHSHIGGHPHDIDHDADYGDILSFYQHVKAHCDAQGSDLWFFMNGDWIHGTGLAMDGNATMLVPLLEHMPWDAVNLGNHEAYKSAVVELMRDDMIPHFGDAFLTSNTLYAETMEPFGKPYRLLQGNNNTLLVFGFLYNLHNPSELLHVNRVQDAMEEEWFRQVLREAEYDAICVLAHMDNDDPLVVTILNKIREHTEDDMPVQFLTGHTHMRKSRRVEKNIWAHAMEAGGFLDTVGFISFPTQKTAQSVRKGLAKTLFRDKLLNSSKSILNASAGVATLMTPEGVTLSDLINKTRNDLGLNEIVGCPPREFFVNRSIHDEDSIFKLWIDHVVPTQIFKHQEDVAMIVSSDTFRYDVRRSGRNDAITVDDIVTIAPYMEPVIYVGEIPEKVIRRLDSSLNQDSDNHHKSVPDYLLVGDFEEFSDHNRPYKLYTHEYNLPEIMHDLDRLVLHDLKPSRIDLKDTLYWLAYAEEAWQCNHDREPKKVEPWFADIKELDEESTDGGRTSEDIDTHLDDELDTENDHKRDPDLHYEGTDGYLPPSAIDQFNDLLPPGMAPTTGLKPRENAPVPAPAPTPKVKHSAAANKAETRERRKKIRRIAFKVAGGIISVLLLMIPVWGLYQVFFPEKNDSGMGDETFYDMKEMRSLRRRNRGTTGHKPMPPEIELS